MLPDRGPTSTPQEATESLWAPTLGVASLLSVIYLTILVMRLQPLPLADLATAGLVATGFSFACILAMVFVLHLPVYSFTLVFAIGTFLMSTSAFLIYPFEGELAFGGFKVILDDGLERGLPVVMLAFAALTLGSSVSSFQSHPLPAPATSTVAAKVEATRTTALILYWIFLVGMLLVSLRGPGIFTAISSGYTGGSGFADLRKAGEMSPAVTMSLNWFLPWLAVILLATSRSERQFTHSTLLAVAVCGFALLSGDRGTTVLMIALLLQIRHLLGYAVRWRRIALLGVLAAAIIMTWPTFRTIPVKDWRPSILAEALQERYSSDSKIGADHSSTVGHLLSGTAPGYQAIMVSCHYVPSSEPYRLGFDYFRSAATAVPYVARVFPGFLRSEEAPAPWMMAKIDPNFWTGRGFNQIAEAYLQGGGMGVLALYLLLGWYLMWLWTRLRGEADLRLLAFHSLVILAIYKWVRNDSGGVGRIIVWAVILIYLLPAVYRWLQERMGGAPPESERLPTVPKPPVRNISAS